MPEYAFLAQDAAGRQVEGTLRASTRREAVVQLASRTLLPVEVKETRERRVHRRGRWTSAHFGQLADLLRTGIPLLKSLEVLRDQASQGELRQLIQEMREGLADGQSLADVMQLHDGSFDPVAVGMVRAGEEGGFLEESLRRIALLQERTEEVRGRVVGALIYPMVLVTVGSLLVLGLLVFFVPSFAPIFERLAEQGQLPWPTRVLMAISGLLRGQGVGLLLAVAMAVLLGTSFVDRTALRARILSSLVHIPYLGRVLREATTARFCRVLGALLRNDVPVVRALKITQGAVVDRDFAQAIQRAAAEIADGGRLAPQLTSSGYPPADVAAMIAVGETANTLDTVLVDAAEILDRRVARRLDLLLKLLEPALLLLMAGVVLFLVIGLMLPIFDASGVNY